MREGMMYKGVVAPAARSRTLYGPGEIGLAMADLSHHQKRHGELQNPGGYTAGAEPARAPAMEID
jgi:hypothetical protein